MTDLPAGIWLMGRPDGFTPLEDHSPHQLVQKSVLAIHPKNTLFTKITLHSIMYTHKRVGGALLELLQSVQPLDISP